MSFIDAHSKQCRLVFEQQISAALSASETEGPGVDVAWELLFHVRVTKYYHAGTHASSDRMRGVVQSRHEITGVTILSARQRQTQIAKTQPRKAESCGVSRDRAE
jgi:hypothetical protein